MPAYFGTLVDVLVVAILLLAVLRGAKKGLILTLFGLATVFLAFFGARFVTGLLSPPITELIRPSIQRAVEEGLSQLPALSDPLSSSVSAELSPSEAGLGEIVQTLRESGLFVGLTDRLGEAVERHRIPIVTTAVAAVSQYLARLAAEALVYSLSFSAILLLCSLLSRTLDLAFRLPVLSQFNRLGGGLLGLAKGFLLVCVLLWALRLAGLLTPDNSGPVAALLHPAALTSLLRPLLGQLASALQP